MIRLYVKILEELERLILQDIYHSFLRSNLNFLLILLFTKKACGELPQFLPSIAEYFDITVVLIMWIPSQIPHSSKLCANLFGIVLNNPTTIGITLIILFH